MLYKNFEELKKSLIKDDGSFAINVICRYDIDDRLVNLANDKNYSMERNIICDEDLKGLFSEPGDIADEYRARWFKQREEWAKQIELSLLNDLSDEIAIYIYNAIKFIRLSNQDVKSFIGFSLDPNDIDDFARKTAKEVRGDYHSEMEYA